MSEPSYYSYERDSHFRQLVMKVGCGFSSLGVIGQFFKLEEQQDIYSRLCIIIGVGMVTIPAIREWQETRLIRDDEEDDGDDEWPPDDDDDDPPPIVPNDPGGLELDWTIQIEDFVNSRQPVSID